MTGHLLYQPIYIIIIIIILIIILILILILILAIIIVIVPIITSTAFLFDVFIFTTTTMVSPQPPPLCSVYVLMFLPGVQILSTTRTSFIRPSLLMSGRARPWPWWRDVTGVRVSVNLRHLLYACKIWIYNAVIEYLYSHIYIYICI